MESWTRVIVEWINCLGIAQPSVEDVRDLQDCVLYRKLVSQLCNKNNETSTTTTTPPLDERELVSEFIKAEYPEFVASNESATGIPDELYIASLLLAQCSQKGAFHQAMCTNLKHETQIHIKKFLEMVLPYGKSITKEIIGVAIMEIGDATPNTPSSTPVFRPLREFFNSPAARSAHSQRFMNDRNRELRRLKAQLETEQFEKADLVQDIRMQEEKIQNLQKKLQQKSQELSVLRNERLKPPTPQSCRKNKRPSDNEERYKRELEQMENANLALQTEIEQLREEREELERRLTTKNRLHSTLKEKFDQYERSMEAISIQLEMKNNELFGLRLNNEELREHIREMQKSSMGEVSFEMEPICRARSPMFFNSSEALSSIIDIQLQEAREESEQLRNQLDGVNNRLEAALQDCEEMKRLNAVLRNKATELETVSVSLRSTEERLSLSTKRAENLELEKSELIENLAKLDSELASNKDQLVLTANRRDALESELNDATSKTRNLEASLESERSKTAELESTVARGKKERDDLHSRLVSTEDDLIRVNEEKTALELLLQKKLKEINESESALIQEKSRATELESTLAAAKKETEDLKNLLETSEESLSRVTEKAENFELKLHESAKKLEDSETTLMNEKIRVAQLESTVARAKEEYQGLENLLRSTDENLSRVSKDKKSLELALEESNEKLEKSEALLCDEKSKVAELELILARTNEQSENLKHQLESSVRELSNFKKINESLEMSLEQSKKKLEEFEISLKNEKALVADLESTISRLQTDSDGLRNELRSNEESLAAETARVADLESTVARGKKDAEDLRNVLEGLRNALENEKSGSAELKTIVSRSKDTCEELESLLRSKEDLLKESQERASSLNSDLQQCRSKIGDLELSLRSETLRSAELEAECSRAKKRCADLEVELASRERDLFETQAIRTNTESQLNELNAEMRKMELDLENLRENLSRVEEEKRQSLLANEKIEERARNADERIASLEAEISEYTRKIKELDESSTEQRKNLNTLRAELTARSSTIEELNQRLDATEKRESAAREALEAAKKKVAELTELGEEVESQLAQERDQLVAIRAEKKSLKEELSSYVRSEADLKERINKIVQELEDSEKKLQAQSDVCAALKKNEAELLDVKRQLEEKLTQEQRQLEVTLNEMQNLERELASYVNSEAILKDQIGKTDEELTEVRSKWTNEVAQLREQLKVTQDEKDALQEKLSSYVRSTADLEKRIAAMEKDLEASNENQRQQTDLVETLRQNVRQLEELREKLENELIDERARLTELRSEKEMLEDEASLYGRSNEDLGNKIVALKTQLAGCSKDLENEREANSVLKKIELQLTDEREKLEKQLAQERERSAVVETEKQNLEKEVSAFARSKADLNEEISALHAEFESSRKDLQQLREVNEKLKEKVAEADARIETLQAYETRSERLACDLETAKRECATSSELAEKLSEELKSRGAEIARALKQLDDVNREKEILSVDFEERIRTSNNLVETLKKRLLSAEQSCEETKLEEKLKEEALGVVRAKLEQLTKEKVESELKMKELIVNLQEVRSSQDGVLEAQARTLKDKSGQLEEAEKELVSLRNALTATTSEIEREKSVCREAEIECVKLKEQNQEQSNLVEKLQIALQIEQARVEESTKRRTILEQNVEEIAKVTGDLKLELNSLWDSMSKACPEIIESRRVFANSQQNLGDSEIQELSLTVQSCTDDAKTICKAVSLLSEANDKLKSDINEIVRVSVNLKLELNALWDSVRRACPELARPKEETPAIAEGNSEISEATRAVRAFADDAETIRKAVSILSEANETLKEHLDGEKEAAKAWAKEAEKKTLELDERISRMENERKNHNRYLEALVERTKNFRESLSTAVRKREQVDELLGALAEKWRLISEQAQGVLTAGSSACDELKHLQLKRTELDDTLSKINGNYARSSKPLLKALCNIFVWSESKLQEAQEPSALVKNELGPENELSEERELVDGEIRKCEKVQHVLSTANEKIDAFSNLLASYEASLKSGAIKRAASTEEKLQSQLDKLSKERNEMKEKLDAMRMRNAKMEKNMDDLRNENKKLKTDVASVTPTDSTELERFEALTEKLQKEVLRLQMENDELIKSKKESDEQDVENRLKEVHNEYGLKLEKIKQKMKTAYNEQIAKLNQEQEKVLKEKMGALRVQMEKQCRKYTEDIAKYKAHISDLSSRYWDVGEKLLAETQEKQAALEKLEQLRGSQVKQEATVEVNQQVATMQGRLKTASLDRREFAADRATRDGASRAGYRAVDVIEEETTTTTTRRHSVKSIQAMGNAFKAEDEDDELFDSVYLTDLKEGRCAPPAGPDFDRLSELRMRNSMCRPHLKSSYAVETHFQPTTLNEDDIKNGVNADDVFNDSLSQSLLPGQKPKKKDRTQTSYKRPGPPTPSKNGRRLSLQGNELKSPTSRVLRERNVDRRTTATPRGLKNLFGTSISKRQDENATSTPKGRRLSNIFRKQRPERN